MGTSQKCLSVIYDVWVPRKKEQVSVFLKIEDVKRRHEIREVVELTFAFLFKNDK